MTCSKTFLLIDAGNSFIKWRLERPNAAPLRGRQPHSHGDGMAQLTRQWLALPRPDRILVSNVADQELAESLKKITRIFWKSYPEFAAITKSAYGITSSYQQPEKLGMDRWLVMIAAHRQIKGPVLIADCGTGVTIDLIDQDGQQLDGVILPGLHSMQSCLLQRTAIPGSADAQQLALAQDTQQAIHKGSLLAIRASISAMQADWKQRLDDDPTLVLTGGDAKEIASGLSCACQIMPELVLDGLQVILESSISSSL